MSGESGESPMSGASGECTVNGTAYYEEGLDSEARHNPGGQL